MDIQSCWKHIPHPATTYYSWKVRKRRKIKLDWTYRQYGKQIVCLHFGHPKNALSVRPYVRTNEWWCRLCVSCFWKDARIEILSNKLSSGTTCIRTQQPLLHHRRLSTMHPTGPLTISGDRRSLCSVGTSNDGFWSSEPVKGSVRQVACSGKKKRKKTATQLLYA